MEADSNKSVECPGCVAAAKRIAELEAKLEAALKRITELEAIIEELRRGDKRQAAPFLQGISQAQFQKTRTQERRGLRHAAGVSSSARVCAE
jgi:hypothetical protein